MQIHPTHKTRVSFDASSYDEICVNCGATDGCFGGDALSKPCPSSKPVENKEQPQPTPNNEVAVWDLVIQDMHTRDKVGRERYGTPLQPHNGRDALQDAYEEALDLCVYLRQAIYERNAKKKPDAFNDIDYKTPVGKCVLCRGTGSHRYTDFPGGRPNFSGSLTCHRCGGTGNGP